MGQRLRLCVHVAPKPEDLVVEFFGHRHRSIMTERIAHRSWKSCDRRVGSPTFRPCSSFCGASLLSSRSV